MNEDELCAMGPYAEAPTMPKQDDDMIFAVLFRKLLDGASLAYPINQKVKLYLPGGHWIPLDTADQVDAIYRYMTERNGGRKPWVPK
jgi:hypothetical protein